MSEAREQDVTTRWVIVFALLSYIILLYVVPQVDRTYWPYMLSAYVMGTAVYFWRARGLPPNERTGLLRFLFPPDVWGHKSAVNDYIMCLVNWLVIHKILTLPGLDFTAYMRGLVDQMKVWVSSPDSAPDPGIWVVAAYVFMSLFIGDLFYYISHWLTHKIPFLWEFHKVHHSAEVMTPFTLYRMHPLDVIFNTVCSAIGAGLVAVVFFYFYPGMTSAMIIGAYYTGYFLINIAGSNLKHSHIWLSFGPVIERFFLSPAQHQIHHSTNPKHFDKNFSSFFSFWDWVFGTLYVPQGREDVSFGLTGEQDDFRTVKNLYVDPFLRPFKKRRSTP